MCGLWRVLGTAVPPRENLGDAAEACPLKVLG